MGVITLQQSAQWCGGAIDPKYKDVTFLGANNDTRKLAAGELFIALQGVRDGHDFIPAALEKGAAAVLCTRCDGDYPAIVVPDTRVALGDIARQERKRIGMKVVGVTGSVGKSTTKEMIAAVLGGTYRVSKTPVNHNNDIGMPMAILAMPEDTQIAVLEMGMNHFGEIAYLSGIAQPDAAVIVNIGTMHIEHLGSKEGILQAKLEILEGLQEGGSVILNGDDPLLWGLREKMSGSNYFGMANAECDIYACDVTEGEESLRFSVKGVQKDFSVVLNLEGMHFVPDAMAAVAVGLRFDVDIETISNRLLQFRNMADRQEIFQVQGYTVIKDCYNAGPESMAAALTVLGKREGRKIAVLGDMLELGARSQTEHYKIGRLAAEKADVMFAYGPNSGRVLSGAITGGMNTSRAFAFEDREKLVVQLKSLAKPGDVLLFKGSRGMQMDVTLDMFLNEEK